MAAAAASPYTDFTQSYDPINSTSQGSTGGSYTVRVGDTLQGITLAVWGDANGRISAPVLR